jgi:predicted hydrocarbon binding protein
MQVSHVIQEEQVKRKDLPFLLLKRDFFDMMFASLLRNFGPAGTSIVFGMGRDRGKEEVKEFRREYSDILMPITKKELLEKVFIRLNNMGWGKFQIKELDPDNGTLRINVGMNPFADKCGLEIKGGCIFLQGLITGVVSESFDKEVSMSNPRCVELSKGYCVFNVNNN